ncbi:GntR family transcriptional regulator [Nocardiopsis synnemataformans]|uniref:GntR family transcriptional regulator n=1 Tax=Nocardiopsis synnemataformans TaxID=61305 RepID=UPI003EBAD145
MVSSARNSGGKPETMVAYASRHIRAALAKGDIKPGGRISPNALAEEFGLSHIPVREALASLAATGYVVHHRGRGYFARELSPEDLDDICQWREVTEREAYRLAVPRLTDGDIAHMRDLVERMSRLLAPEDRFAYVELDREFHFTCFRRVGSQRLLTMLDYLWDSAQPYATLEPTGSGHSHAEHVDLLALLVSGETDAVIDGMRRHRRTCLAHAGSWEQGPDQSRR